MASNGISKPFYMKNLRNREQWIALVALYRHRCVSCFKRLGWRKLTVDHVVPEHLGGADAIDNIQPLCNPCNAGKFRKTTDYRGDFEKRWSMLRK